MDAYHHPHKAWLLMIHQNPAYPLIYVQPARLLHFCTLGKMTQPLLRSGSLVRREVQARSASTSSPSGAQAVTHV